MTSDPAASPESKQTAEKPVILIVDDSRLMRHAIKKILAEDFALLEAADGEDGWDKLNADPSIQVVFSDLSMPGLDGFGLLQRIRGADEARLRDLPVIVITGNEDDETIKEKALRCGATDFITKPFQSVQIRARAEAHAKHQRKLQEVSSALEEQTTVDAVTQLANPRFFMQRGNENLSFAIRHKSELALIVLELDRFAELTEAMDAATRDQILVGVAEILRAHTRREDTVARLSEARFALWLPASNPVGTRHLGKRILGEIEQLKFFHGGRRVKLAASMGIATPDIKTDTTLEGILNSAERRLSVAAQGGGNCLVKDDQTTAQSLQETARQAAEQEAKERAAEEARVQAEEAARLKAEQEARFRADEEARAKAEAEARARAEEEARIRAEAEARQRAEEEERRRAEEEARLKAEQEARARAEEEARIRAEQEARIKAEEEARLRAEEEARIKAEEEARYKAQEEERARAEAEARIKAEEEARIKAEEEARLKAEAEARQRAEVLAQVQREREEQSSWMQELEAAQSEAEGTSRSRAGSEQHARFEEQAREQSEIAAARQQAEQETARARAEAESRRRVMEEEARARAAEEVRRRTEMEAELARVEAELRRPRGNVADAAAAADEPPPRLAPPLAVLVRAVLPVAEALNRRFNLKLDAKLEALRKRI